jgi:Mg/Co/Ni transporter MgtE
MRDLRNRVIKRAFFLGTILFFISFFINRDFSLGILLGTTISIINFLLLYFQIKKIAEKKFLFFTFFGYIMRYLFMGLALFLAIKINFSMFFGTAIGLFAIRGAIYLTKDYARDTILG